MTDPPNELAGLPRESTPPAHLAGAIANRLRREGLLRRKRTRLYAVAAAILIAITAVGFWNQTRTPVQPRYILLLYESPGFTGGSRTEYANWAREMRPLVVGGEELASGAVLSLPGESTERLAGYFLIDARDDVEAVRVARASPHLKYGGSIVLRRIVF